MRSTLCSILSAAGLLAMLACGNATGPGTTRTPPLEQVDFDAIGSGSVLFSRTDSGDYLIDGATRTVTALPNRFFWWGPRLSPDGTRITGLHLTDVTSFWDVYVMDLADTGPRQISAFPDNPEGSPAWTGDGTGVVYMLAPVTNGAARGIYRWDAATGTSQFLRRFVPDSTGSYRCPGVFVWFIEDGTVAVSKQGGVAYACLGALVVAANPDDSLAIRYDNPDESVGGVAWSPDGREVAFIGRTFDATRNRVVTTVHTLRVADGTVETIASHSAHPASAYWHEVSPHDLCWLVDGSGIVFTASTNDAEHTDVEYANLYVVRPDGTHLTQLTSAPGAFDHNVSCAGGR